MNPPHYLGAAEIARYREQGYLVVPDLVPAAHIDAFLEHEAGLKAGTGPRGLQNHRADPAWMALAGHPEVVVKVAQLIGGAPHIVQTMYLAKPPGGGTGVALHQDTHYIRTEPDTLMACWIACSDTGADNGGLCVVPGSHTGGLLETGPVRQADEHARWEKAYPMRAPDGRTWTETMHAHDIHSLARHQVEMLQVPTGSGVFFTSLTVHGSYANRSAGQPRLAFAIHYVRAGTWVYRCDLQDPVPAPMP